MSKKKKMNPKVRQKKTRVTFGICKLRRPRTEDGLFFSEIFELRGRPVSDVGSLAYSRHRKFIPVVAKSW